MDRLEAMSIAMAVAETGAAAVSSASLFLATFLRLRQSLFLR